MEFPSKKQAFSLFGVLCVFSAIYTGVCFYKNSAISQSHAVKVMTVNMGSTTNHLPKQPIEKVVSIIQKESPDIIMLQEAYLPKAEKLAEFLDYRLLSIPGEEKQHVWILSKLPIQSTKTKKLSSYVTVGKNTAVGKNVACAEIEFVQTQMLICSVYLTSIRTEIINPTMRHRNTLAVQAMKEIFTDTSRSRGTRELVDWLASMNCENIVVGGDFNSLFLSKATRIMRSKFKDSSWLTPSLFSSSHKVHKLFHLPVKVDYIFHSKNLFSSGTRIIPESPGDHYPVVTNIYLN